MNANIRLDKVFGEYRRRFGIESSYKLMNIVRAKTTRQDPTTRLLLVLVALLVVNHWVAPPSGSTPASPGGEGARCSTRICASRP